MRKLQNMAVKIKGRSCVKGECAYNGDGKKMDKESGKKENKVM